MNCPRCHTEDARYSPVFGILPGERCVTEDRTNRKITRAPEFYTQTMQTRVQAQRDIHEKEMTPMYDVNGNVSEEYKRAYPQQAQQAESELNRITNAHLA